VNIDYSNKIYLQA